MMACFDALNDDYFEVFIQWFNPDDLDGRKKLNDFTLDVLSVFHQLISNMVYDASWSSFIMVLNWIISKTLCQFSSYFLQNDYFPVSLDPRIFQNYFLCAVAFVTQPILQLENFSQPKCIRIVSSFKDMRKNIASEVTRLWCSLSIEHKVSLVPNVADKFVQMSLIPETELRKITIPIFFDMLMSDHTSDVHSTSNSSYENNLGECDSCTPRPIGILENTMIMSLDTNMNKAGDGAGSGDQEYTLIYKEIMTDFQKYQREVQREAQKFVTRVS